MDGIDAALVTFDSPSKPRLVETYFHEFEPSLRAEIYHTAQNNLALRQNQDSPLHVKLASVYAKACMALLEKAEVKPEQVNAIANHGQTVKHEPTAKPPYSLQLGDGQIIANLTQIKTITQFRQADLAAGGQGAPLMPAFHSAVFGTSADTLVLNIGGIANLSRLGSPLIGYDTGPGNVLLDQWIERHHTLSFDKNGTWAASGKVNTELLNKLLADPYFSQPHPKSTGTDYFNLDWLERRFNKLQSISPAEVQATLLVLTTESIALQVEHLRQSINEQISVFVCGGGAQNSKLMQVLTARLENSKVDTTDALGIPSDWLEAIGFAWLGYCKDHDIISNCPSVTGAQFEVVLGEEFIPV